MNIIQVPIGELKPAEYNPRRADKDQIKHLTASIKKFGLVDPIIVNENPKRKNVVVGGHFRLRIAKDLGMKEVPVFYVNLNEDDERELNLRLNKNVGEWDWDLLANFSEELLKSVGFSKELDRLQSKWHRDEDFDAEAEHDAIKTPNSQRGEVYELGRHRVMCGDSTNPKDVHKLMGNERADLLFTDPPYNVDYNYAKYDTIRKSGKRKFANINKGRIFNDKMPPEEFQQFLTHALVNGHKFTTETSPAYICHATSTFPQFLSAFRDAGYHWNANLIWLKEGVSTITGDYLRCFEPMMYGWKEGNKHYVNKEMWPDRDVIDLDRQTFESRLDVWYERRDRKKDYEHPTQKPVKLMERSIKMSCIPDGKVLDLFGGGGSTLVAAEITGRTAYLMELDPAYCDVIRKRYKQFETPAKEKTDDE